MNFSQFENMDLNENMENTGTESGLFNKEKTCDHPFFVENFFSPKTPCRKFFSSKK